MFILGVALFKMPFNNEFRYDWTVFYSFKRLNFLHFVKQHMPLNLNRKNQKFWKKSPKKSQNPKKKSQNPKKSLKVPKKSQNPIKKKKQTAKKIPKKSQNPKKKSQSLKINPKIKIFVHLNHELRTPWYHADLIIVWCSAHFFSLPFDILFGETANFSSCPIRLPIRPFVLRTREMVVKSIFIARLDEQL